jgi:hypothetical protein
MFPSKRGKLGKLRFEPIGGTSCCEEQASLESAHVLDDSEQTTELGRVQQAVRCRRLRNSVTQVFFACGIFALVALAARVVPPDAQSAPPVPPPPHASFSAPLPLAPRPFAPPSQPARSPFSSPTTPPLARPSFPLSNSSSDAIPSASSTPYSAILNADTARACGEPSSRIAMERSALAAIEEWRRPEAAAVLEGIRGDHEDVHSGTSQCGEGSEDTPCHGRWCCFSSGATKVAFRSKDDPTLVVKFERRNDPPGSSRSPRSNLAELTLENTMIGELCVRGDGQVAHRVPWTSAPFRVGEGESVHWGVLQQALGGRWFKLRIGLSYLHILLNRRIDSSAAARSAHDLLAWESLLAEAGIVLNDLQFHLAENGEVWFVDADAPPGGVLARTFSRSTAVSLRGRPSAFSIHDFDEFDDDAACLFALRNAYSNLRQRASLLSLSLASVLVAEGGAEGVDLVRSMLCHIGTCEFGCSFRAVPASALDMLADSPQGQLIATRLAALIELHGLPVPASSVQIPPRIVPGEVCTSSCCCDALDTPMEMIGREASTTVDVCDVEYEEFSLGMEGILSCLSEEWGLSAAAAVQCEVPWRRNVSTSQLDNYVECVIYHSPEVDGSTSRCIRTLRRCLPQPSCRAHVHGIITARRQPLWPSMKPSQREVAWRASAFGDALSEPTQDQRVSGRTPASTATGEAACANISDLAPACPPECESP